MRKENENEKIRSKFIYHWAKENLDPELKKFLVKDLPWVGKGKMVKNAIHIWRGHIARQPNTEELSQKLDEVLVKWETANKAKVHESYQKKQLKRPEIQEKFRENQRKKREGIKIMPILPPEHFGIHPTLGKDIAKEDEINNQWYLGRAHARRADYSPNDPFIKVGFRLAKLAAEQRCYISVFQGNNVGTFARDNYGSLPFYFLQQYEIAEKTVVIIRRFESGPTEPRTGLPYKTIAGMIYQEDEWVTIEEEGMKDALTIDHRTGKKIPTEDATLFSTIPEMFPELLTN